MLENLKEEVLQANMELAKSGLVALTWGNVSGIDAERRLVVIKPSGIAYDALCSDDMVVVHIDGVVVEGTNRPSSDLPTHLKIYNAYPSIGGISHTHSTHASMFAQACREIPCLGTTHADHFFGPVPVTRFLTKEEVNAGYEANTGTVIVERFAELDVVRVPGVLVAGHGPFTWGKNAHESVHNAIALEQIAHMALGTFQLNPEIQDLPAEIRLKHFERKHGTNAYYGQK
jgi:L-ribulose-5-phosphate 4-epimerase